MLYLGAASSFTQLRCTVLTISNSKLILKSEEIIIILNIRGPLDVNTKSFYLLRYILFFLTKYGLSTSYPYLTGEKIGQYFAQKTMILVCKGSKVIEVR